MNGSFSPIASSTGTIWLWRSSGRTFCSWNATAASSFSSSALATGAFAALCASSFSICGSANVAKEEVINDRTPSWTTRSIGFSPPHALAVERRRGAVLPCLSYEETRTSQEARVERVTKRVADKVEGEHRCEDRKTGERRDPRRVDDVAPARRQHVAPVRGRWLRPETEEAQAGGVDDRRTDVERRLDDDRRKNI